MVVLRLVIAGLRALLWRRRLEEELTDELHGFLEAAIQQEISAGKSREEVVREARLELGSMEAVKDEVFETWVGNRWWSPSGRTRGMPLDFSAKAPPLRLLLSSP